MSEDEQLLGQYTRERSEAAFGELVERHIDLVFSAALRVVGGDSHLAQDVTQIVFTDLARKAWGLPGDVVLPGWLYRHTCFTAAKAVRTERRRQAREQTAMEMNTLDDCTEPDWEALAPHLDEGLNELSAADRDAIVLHFLRQQDLRAVGAALGVSEDAAQKRVSRAVEKLRGILSRRGVTLTAATIGSLMVAEAVKAAPAGLAVSVTTTSLAAATTAGTGITLAIMKVMAMTKLQITVAGAVLVAAVATPLVFEHQSLNQAREENNRIREENLALQAQSGQLAALVAENQRLSNLVVQVIRPAPPEAPDQMAELLRLRSTVTRLQTDAKAGDKETNTMSDMIRSPQMKEFMKTVSAMTVDKSYRGFFADAHLTPEQSAALRDLIINKQMAGLDLGLSTLSGDSDPAKRKELLEQLKTAQASVDEQIRQLLGDENYARFQDYQKGEAERQTIALFQDQLTPRAALTPAQEQQLVEVMRQEQEHFKFTVDLSDRSNFNGNLASFYTPERTKQFQQDLERRDQQYLARAREILSADQLQSFEKFLAQQRDMTAASMQMSSKLFAPK